ncbi:hypothetical protein [Paraclostridium bifermentans]|uniref:hypothetical protein n=1 Tax=Paraclostridium bifermentans TaxID=1490 RepID=UPI00374F6714
MTYKICNFIFEYEESKYYIQVEEGGVEIDTIKVKTVLIRSEFESECNKWYMNDTL